MKYRVLVFGEAGVGKTSLCNVLSGGRRQTDNGPLGVTTKSHLYAPFSFESDVFEIVDTAGLHESIHGTVPADQAAQQLIDLLHKSKDGFSLLVHVSRAGRITQAHDEDFDFFANKLTERKIPVVLVVTGCENDHPMSSWAARHAAAFDRFGYAAIIPSCFASGGRLEEVYGPLREESRAAVLAAVKAHASPVAIQIYGGDTGIGFADLLTRVWNSFAELAGLPAKYRRELNTSTVSWLRRIGVPKSLADSLAMHIPDLAKELGDKVIPVPWGGTALKAVVETAIKHLRK